MPASFPWFVVGSDIGPDLGPPVLLPEGIELEDGVDAGLSDVDASGMEGDDSIVGIPSEMVDRKLEDAQEEVGVLG